MENNTKTYSVTNRSTGTLAYHLPEFNNVRRLFAPNETKVISYAELEALSFKPGGASLIHDYLEIHDANVPAQLGIPTEREYYMGEADIRQLMLTGSIDAFLDCLDFAPTGVHDIIKKLAVEMPLNDVAKRDAIKEKLGFDVTKAIENIAPEEPEAPKVNTGRRVQETAAESEKPRRRVRTDEDA